MNNNFRNLAAWIAIGVFIFVLYNMFQNEPALRKSSEISYSQFLSQVEAGKVESITLTNNLIRGKLTNNNLFYTLAPQDPFLFEKLQKKNVDITVKNEKEDISPLLSIFLSSLPILLLIGIWVYMLRQMQGGGRGAMSFGRSKAKLLTENTKKVTFADVAGVDESKEELEEIVEFLRDARRFQRLGGKIPHGTLLVGPPGTGKTLLARAVAGEANVPFFSISGSDFVEMFVGVGASRVRDMFEQAKKNAPCIVFIDEIDAVGRHRGAGYGGGNDEREQTLNQLLVEMDGFEENEGVIIIAATNRPDVLDPALLRPGRFDRQVVVPYPDIDGRTMILNVHSKKTPLAPDVDIHVIARGTPGFSGADLANIVNEAALLAARRGKRFVTHQEFEDAKDKVMMGAERRSLAMTEEDKKLTAYHEGGHALVAIHLKDSHPVHKATIIPRGRALGMVMRLPQRDELSVTRARMKADLAVAMGGRIAEELIFGADMVTSGASSDIQMATKLARSMVTRFGMSDKIGPMDYHGNDADNYLNASQGVTTSISDETRKVVDTEIRKLVDEGYKKASQLLQKHIQALHKLAHALIEYETLSGDEIKDILSGKPIRVSKDDDSSEGKSGKKKSRFSVPQISEADRKKASRKRKPKDDGMEPQAT